MLVLQVFVRQVGVAAIVLVGLAACGGKPDPILEQMFGLSCNGTAAAICSEQPPSTGEAKTSRYCYRTIGDNNCFDRPDPDRKNQEIGTSSP